jgi:mannosyltransferase OCH1-like enzyme
MFKSIENGYKIPNIIHYTFMNDNLPNEIIQIIENNKKMCPLCEFRFYDDLACDDFIKINFDDDVYSAFKMINDIYGAMKADFFRYCVLYKIGGIYIDVKSVINYPIFKLIRKEDICILDIPRNNLEPWRKNKPTHEQWLLIFAPGHPYLNNMIKRMVVYIKSNFEPKIKRIPVLNSKQKILHVTGPDAFAKSINECIKKNKSALMHRTIDYNKYFMLNACDYVKMYEKNGKKHYSQYTEPLYKKT